MVINKLMENEYKSAWSSFYDKYPNCFSPPSDCANGVDYMSFFERRYNIKFKTNAHPTAYHLSLLDFYKDKIAASFWATGSQSSRHLIIIIQEDFDKHIMATLGFSQKNKELIVYCEILAPTGEFFLDFTKQHAKLEHTETQEKTFGFGTK